MSQQLINHNADLLRLRTEGYDVEVRGGLLLVKNIPYVTSSREVVYDGMLVCPLTLSGNTTGKPSNHVVHWSGSFPCFANGKELEALRHSQGISDHGNGVSTQYSFSNKPKGGYPDFFEKMDRYAHMISVQASAIDPDATAKGFRPVATSESESLFCFADTATPRAGIAAINGRLSGLKLGIVGLGGTGSAILDLLAKTPVAEIHLYDGDKFLSHNAFRSPGAASLTELENGPNKVDYFAQRYSAMRRGIITHDCFITSENLDLLDGLDFVFLSVDSGTVRQYVAEYLGLRGIPFIDVGMGLTIQGGKISGQIRTTLSKPGSRDFAEARIPLGDLEVDNAYVTNIQVAELNTLNAAFAIIQWKKNIGFYNDEINEGHFVFTIEDSETVSVSNETDEISA